MTTCPVFLPDTTLCNKPALSVHRGLCREHAHYSKKRGYYLGFNMIVKNEDNCLEKTLTCIKPIADEITVTDTGSSDATVSIALKYADKVLFHEWQDSFSEARNWSLQYSTADWICAIDADEWLVDPDNVLAILRQCNGAMAVNCPIESEMPNGRIATNYFPRVFRYGTAHYEGIVHNQLIHREPSVVAPITFRHTGYIESAEIMTKKHQRTIRLLRKQLEDNPENVFTLTNLARALRNEGEHTEAESIVERALKLDDIDPHTLQMLLFMKMLTAIREDLPDTRALIKKGLSMNCYNTDFLYLRANYEMRQRNWVDALLAIRTYQHAKQSQYSIHRENLILDYWDVGVVLNQMLGTIYLNIGQYSEAKREFAVVLKSNRYDKEVWEDYIHCCGQTGDKDALRAAVHEKVRLGLEGAE